MTTVIGRPKSTVNPINSVNPLRDHCNTLILFETTKHFIMHIIVVYDYDQHSCNNAITVPHRRCCRANKRKMQLHLTQRPVITVAKTPGNLMLTYK